MASQRNVGLKHGFRSGLENTVALDLKEKGIAAEYESETVAYTKPARKSKYTPDFILPNGIIIETKGRFVTEDRQKHLIILNEHPELDIRFVFSNPRTRISKQSKTSYAMWCEKHGFQYAKGLIPPAWMKKPRCKVRINALYRARHKKNA